MAIAQKDYFNEMVRKHSSNAILVPGASSFRNIILNKTMRKTLSPILSCLHDKDILEVGCGVGRWVKIISKKNRVIGVDVSREMIRKAKSVCKSEKCSFIVADVSYLPLKNDVCDLAISITILQHILDDFRFVLAMNEIARCSRSELLFMEEMWSKKEIILDQAYCPIRIVPAEQYSMHLRKNRIFIESIGGTTLAPLAVLFAGILARRQFKGGISLDKIKSLKVVSLIVHFVMGIGVVPAIIVSSNKLSLRLSLHTMILARKKEPTIATEAI